MSKDSDEAMVLAERLSYEINGHFQRLSHICPAFEYTPKHCDGIKNLVQQLIITTMIASK